MKTYSARVASSERGMDVKQQPHELSSDDVRLVHKIQCGSYPALPLEQMVTGNMGRRRV